MRLGVSTSFIDGENVSADTWIKRHLDQKCETAVFPLNCYESEEKVMEYAKAASDHDVTIAEVGIWRNALAKDADERKAVFEYSVGQLLLADKVKARCCVNVAGTPHGPRWDGGYRNNFDSETRKEIVKSIREIIDEAKPVNTKFTLEPMPWMVPTGPDDYLRLLDEVERDEFAVHLDVVNMVTSPDRYFYLEEFLEECFDKLGDKIMSCHLKDIKLLEDFTFQLRECGCGEGILNVAHYAKLATACDADMPMIIEHLSSYEDYIQSMAYVRKLLL